MQTLQVTYLQHPSLGAPQSSLPMKATVQAGLKICRSSPSPALRVVPRPLTVRIPVSYEMPLVSLLRERPEPNPY